MLQIVTKMYFRDGAPPGDYNLAAVNTMLDEVIAWSTALTPLRQASSAA